VSGTPPVSLVCCDLTGTIATDRSVLEKAFAEAIATQGVVPGTGAYARLMVQVDRSRGLPPRDVMRALFGDEAKAQAAYLAFERSYRAIIDRFGAVAAPAALEVLASLSGSGLKVCLISGFSRAISRFLLDRLGASRQADLILCLDDVPRGAPWPDLVLTAVLRLGAEDVAQVAVVGDSENVITCGRRAGAGTLVGVAAPRAGQRLRRAGTTHLIRTIADLPGVLVPSDTGPAASAGDRAADDPPAQDSPRYARPGTVPPQVTFSEKHAGL
jgi:phosphoglycolate phosphatase